MGTDITGAIAHQLRFPPSESLAAEMTTHIEKASPFIKPTWMWKAGYDNESNFRVVSNTGGGPTVWIGHRAALINTGVGWEEASKDKRLAGGVSLAVLTIARFFKSPRVVLMPDDIEPWCDIKESILNDGWTLDELEGRLRQIRAPAPDLKSALQGSPDREVNGFVVLKMTG